MKSASERLKRLEMFADELLTDQGAKESSLKENAPGKESVLMEWLERHSPYLFGVKEIYC
jgi:hypothetical protein